MFEAFLGTGETILLGGLGLWVFSDWRESLALAQTSVNPEKGNDETWIVTSSGGYSILSTR